MASLLRPYSSEAFAREFFAQQPLYLSGKQHPKGPTRFAHLFGWQALNDLLNLNPRLQIRIHQAGLNYFYTPGVQNLGEAMMRLRQGGTLILEGIDHANATLAQFADQLSDEIATAIQINLYLSYPGHAGYPCHYDAHDFFILQIEGQKLWDVYPATQSFPLDVPPSFKIPGLPPEPHAQAPDESQKLLQVNLQAGDLLYVPRGFWHQALAIHSPSLHLTVGLRKQTGIDFFKWLSLHLQDSELLRQTFPWIQKQDLPAQAGEASPYQAHFETLRNALFNLLNTPDLLHRFHQDSYLNLERRQGFDLPHLYLQPEALLQIEQIEIRQIPHKIYLNAQAMLELVFPRNNLYFAAEAQPLLNFIFAHQQLSRDELQAAFPAYAWSELSQVLLPLIQEGLLHPVPRSR